MLVLLVDDEKLQLMRLQQAVESVLPDAELRAYTNPVQALEENKTAKIDIAFLDIEMPQINGIMLAKQLKAKNPRVNIIFVTAYENYAREALNIHASGYISKPANAKRVQEEINGLRFPVETKGNKVIKAKCFGNFEVFASGKPLKFTYSKSKEMFAYLVDREGSAVTLGELNAVLWEEDHPSYLRNLISDVRRTLQEAGADGVFVKRHNECYIHPEAIDCDAYEYKHNNPVAIRNYRGEYMIQYSWAYFHAE